MYDTLTETKIMSMVQKEAIEVVAQTVGITNLSSDVATALAPDVEYRVREIMQEAIKCMRHSKRTTLTTEDVDAAFKLRNVEPIYGFTSKDALRFKRAAGHKDLYYIDDKDVEFKDVFEAPFSKMPLDTSVSAHWLAVEGVQPEIPENVSLEALIASDSKKSESKEDGLPVDKLPVKHVLSRELQLYYDKITQLAASKSDSIVFRQALMSLTTDSGLQPLVPHFSYFIADEVTRSLNNLSFLFVLMRLARSLLQNLHVHIEPYLHQLMPSIITCLVGKKLGNRSSDDHWVLRNLTANLVASICKRFGQVYRNLQRRVTRTLLHVFLDPTQTLPQHYGAIKGLAALGPTAIRLLIIPNLEPYLLFLKHEMKKHEVWRVYGALQCATGAWMSDQLKVLSSLPSPPSHPILKSNVKVMTSMPNKRKASTDNLIQQPPLKKVATDDAFGVMPMNSMTVDMQGATTGGFISPVGAPTMGARKLSSANMSAREVSSRASKMSTGPAQAWKEDMDTGSLLAYLFELFGESMFAFVPQPESSVFL